MSIRFPCPSCDNILKAPDEAVGKKARCPKCGNIARVPEAAPSAGPPAGEAQAAPAAPAEPAGLPQVQQFASKDDEIEFKFTDEDERAAPSAPAPEKKPKLPQATEKKAEPAQPQAAKPHEVESAFGETDVLDSDLLKLIPIQPPQSAARPPVGQPGMSPPPPPPPPPSMAMSAGPSPDLFAVQEEPAAPASGKGSFARERPRPQVTTSFAGDCFKSIGYGFLNIGNIIILLILLGMCSVGLTIVLVILGAALLHSVLGLVIFCFMLFVAMVLLTGFCSRYYLDVTADTIEGNDKPPTLPDWNFGVMWMTGLRVIGTMIVYVLPVVTLPLLPMGLLGLAHANDGRAFNLIWAVRALIKRPVQYLALLGVCLLSYVGSILLAVAIGSAVREQALLAHGAAERILWSCTGQFVVALVSIVIGTVFFRCLGIYGRVNREGLALMPETPNGTMSLGFLGVGAILTFIVYLGLGQTIVEFAKELTAQGSATRRPGQQVFLPLDTPPTAKQLEAQRYKEVYYAGVLIGQEVSVYSSAHDGKLPVSNSELLNYSRSTAVRDYLSSYIWVPDALYGSDIVLRSAVTWEGKTAVIFAGGNCEQMPCEEFERLASEQHDRAIRGVRSPDPGRPPSPPSDPAVAEINRQRYEAARQSQRRVADAVVAFRNRNGGSTPASSSDLLSQLGGSAIRNEVAEFVWVSNTKRADDVLCRGIRQYDGKVLFIYVDGRATELPFDELERRLSDQSMRVAQERTVVRPPDSPPVKPPIGPITSVPAPEPFEPDPHLRRQAINETDSAMVKADKNMHNLGTDLLRYAKEHDGSFPATLEELRSAGYVKDAADLISPAGKQSYAYLPGLSSKDITCILAYDSTGRGTATVLRASGTVGSLLEVSLRDTLARQAKLTSQPTTGSGGVEIATSRPAGGETPKLAGGKVVWNVSDWPDLKLDRTHPFVKLCDVTSGVQGEKDRGFAGVQVGPEVKDKTDAAYVQFKQDAEKSFNDMLAEEKNVTGKQQIKQKIDGVEYDRMLAYRNLNMLTVLVNVENGRCVAYWFAGTPTCFTKFATGLGKVSVRKE